jgi:plastocyanin
MPPGSPMINSGLMGQGERFSFTPTVAGTWTYFCEVHPAQMAGATVTVQ